MSLGPNREGMDATDLLGERHEYDMVIDGEAVGASGGGRFDVAYPYDGTAWASVPEATATDVDDAVGAARRRFESDAWADLSATDRGNLLFALADEIEATLGSVTDS